jgi:hypothetical protein
MRKSSDIKLTIEDIVKGSIPTHEGLVGDFSVSLRRVILDKIGGEDMFPDFKIDRWRLESDRVDVDFSWLVRPKIDTEHMEALVLEIMEKVYNHRKEFTPVNALESDIREVFMDNFDPMED